jgi:thymidylate kinase
MSKPAGGSGSEARGPVKREGLLMSVALILWGLALSLEKSRRLRASWKARNLGMIVVADRYPQTQVSAFNDGPLLGHYANHRSRLLRRIAHFEAAPYRQAEKYPPDLVVKLNVSPETAVGRKPELTQEVVERRVAAIQSLAYRAPTRVADVDANQPLDAVSREVKRLVWDQI